MCNRPSSERALGKMSLKLAVGLTFLTTTLADVLFTYRLPVTPELKRQLGYPEDNYLNFTERAAAHNFEAREYHAQTDDGYIIKVFNLRSPRCKTFKQPPVLLMHGFLLSADVWLDAGPDAALGYLLAEACYDLWLGNLRGNTYGRQHVKLNPDKDAEFWKFSQDEQGYYDVPAEIDLVLEKTNSTKLNYIGYSQGGLTLSIALSTHPEYNDKLGVFIGLAPAIRMTNCRSIPFRLFGYGAQLLQPFLQKIGIYEIFAQNQLAQVTLEFICKKPGLLNRVICIGFIVLLDNYDPGSISERTLQILYSHFPAGINVRQFAKYGQMFESTETPKYDYGPLKNLQKYGSVIAPNFPIERVTVPTVLVTGLSDRIVSSVDVKSLQFRLPNVLEYYEVADPRWNHLDVTYSDRVPYLLFPKVDEYLSKYSNNTR